MNEFAIVNATVIQPDRVLDGGAVLVRDGLIAEVAPTTAALRERRSTRLTPRAPTSAASSSCTTTATSTS